MSGTSLRGSGKPSGAEVSGLAAFQIRSCLVVVAGPAEQARTASLPSTEFAEFFGGRGASLI